jgi:hypothetical protein
MHSEGIDNSLTFLQNDNFLSVFHFTTYTMLYTFVYTVRYGSNGPMESLPF